MIEPEDEPAAEEAFLEDLDAVPGDSAAWGRPEAIIDVENLLEPRRAALETSAEAARSLTRRTAAAGAAELVYSTWSKISQSKDAERGQIMLDSHAGRIET
jgi:hypothetical protein